MMFNTLIQMQKKARKAMNARFTAALFISLFAGPSMMGSVAHAQDSLGIVAVVNDDAVSGYDLNSRLNLVIASSGMPNNSDVIRRLLPQVLRTLIDERLQLQEAKRLEFNVTKEAIDRGIKQIESQAGMPPGGMDDFLRNIQVPKSVLVEQVTANLAWNEIVNQVIRPGVVVGDDEIDLVIKEVQENVGKPEYLVGEIFLPFDKESDRPKARAFAERLIEEIRQGSGFQSLAQNFSQSPSAATGGDLGWVRPSQLSADLATVVTKMQKGQVSNPIETLNGFYILALRDVRASQGLAGAEAEVSLFQLHMSLSQGGTDYDRQSTVIRAADATRQAKTCEDMAAIAQSQGSQLSGQLPKVKPSSLAPGLRSVVEGLPVNQPSQPVAVQDGVLVLMVCERFETDALDVTRQQITRVLLNDRITAAARRYMRELRRAAFIDIRL